MSVLKENKLSIRSGMKLDRKFAASGLGCAFFGDVPGALILEGSDRHLTIVIRYSETGCQSSLANKERAPINPALRYH
jgi:hypothetical protein